MNKHFTSIAYSNTDFLIQSQYVASGVYLNIQKDSKRIVFDRETLPHLHIGELLEDTFDCKSHEDFCVVLVLNEKDFASDVRDKIVNFTETAFPASRRLALSVSGSVSGKILDAAALRLLPAGISKRMEEVGVCAISFSEDGRKQLLISPDMLLRKFFAIGAFSGGAK